MVPFPEDAFIDAQRKLVEIDRTWIPDTADGSLYLRPFMIANEVFLGVKPATEYLFITIASAVGSYFKDPNGTVTVWLSEHYTRAAPGGTGAAKCGGNYASSLAAQAEAASKGCEQVVFLDAAERRYVEELGGMNVFFVFEDGTLLTPPLSDSILPGITRDFDHHAAREAGLTVREELYAIDQWREDVRSGRQTEAFACGTAAVITPIGRCAAARTTSPSATPSPARWRAACAACWSTSSGATPTTRTAGSRRSSRTAPAGGQGWSPAGRNRRLRT